MDFAAVDDFLLAHLGGDDAVLAAALARSDAAGLPAINVSAPQGKFLYLLARLIGAQRILEIGTLAGYSTIWLARVWRKRQATCHPARAPARHRQVRG